MLITQIIVGYSTQATPTMRDAMPADPIRLLKFCQEIEETPHDLLREMDRETLLGVRLHYWNLSGKWIGHC